MQQDHFRRSRGIGTLTVLAAAFAITLCSGTGVEAKERKKAPSAAKALKQVHKSLHKAKNYSVTLKVEGGIAKDADHSISDRAVSEEYRGVVYRNKMMHVPGMKSFRTPKKGVKFTGGQWKILASDKKGAVMERLFNFPLAAVGDAAKFAKKAEWVVTEAKGGENSESKSKAGEDSDLDSDDASESDEAKAEDSKKGKKNKRTAVKKGRGAKDAGKEAAENLPNVLRIDTPPKAALTHFLKVENSGCLSGG